MVWAIDLIYRANYLRSSRQEIEPGSETWRVLHSCVTAKLTVTCCLLLLWLTLPARGWEIRVEASPVHGTLYLLESLRGEAHHSRHLAKVFRELRPPTEEDQALVDDFARLLQDESWNTLRLPGDGEKRRTLSDVLEGISLQTRDVEDFVQRTRPLLSTEHHGRLARAMRHYVPLYDRLIYQPCQSSLSKQRSELSQVLGEREAALCLATIAALYQSDWPPEDAFVVALTPIPRKEGDHFDCFGHSDGYLSVVEAPQGAPVLGSAGVIVHELCHALWSNRPPQVAARLKQAFPADVYDQLNEGLATALGNGWFGQGKPDESWYNDPIIDGFARALLPLIRPYLEGPKPLDEAFAVRATAAFAATFPEADRDPTVVLRRVLLIANSDEIQRGGFQQRMARLGPMRSIHAATPLSSPETLQRYQDFEGAVIFLIKPSERGLLTPFALSGLARKTGRGWRIVLEGETLADQERALAELLEQPLRER